MNIAQNLSLILETKEDLKVALDMFDGATFSNYVDYLNSENIDTSGYSNDIQGQLQLLQDTKERFRVSLGLDETVPFSEYVNYIPPQWKPSDLFAGGVVGAWYDPSDLSTLFKDIEGTQPVTASGDPVGRILDKSGNGNHAVVPNSSSRPTYRRDNQGLCWLEFDRVDDSLIIPININSKTMTLGLSYLQSPEDTAFILMNSISSSSYVYNGTSNNTGGIASGATVNFTRFDGVEIVANNRGLMYDNLTTSNVFTGSATFNTTWGTNYGYSSFAAKSLTGFRRTTGYVIAEGLSDTAQLEKFLAKKSGIIK